MATMTITIDLDNAAYQDAVEPGTAVADGRAIAWTLEDMAQKLRDGRSPESISPRDYNGNTVGSVKVAQ